MNSKIFVYDPTAFDKLSSVRGIGRYLQILKENFGKSWIFTDNIKRIPIDSVFINPFYNFLKSPLSLKRIAKKQIAVIHDLIPLKYSSHFPSGIKGTIYILLNKLALRNYDLIITDSEASKVDIINILNIRENKIRVIYPCLPKSFINPKSEIRNPKQFSNLENSNFKFVSSFEFRASSFCLYVGDATWNKNLVNMARAIKIANITCVFVGKVFSRRNGVASEEALREADCRDNRQSLAEEECHERLSHPWLKELKEFFELTKDDKRFIFTGFVPDSELMKLYKQTSVNLLLSSAEGFGFSYLEASNFSCPSLLSDIPVLKEISNNQALFVNPLNPHDIADKINEIYFNKVLRTKIGTAAKKRLKFFSAKKFKEEFLKIINNK